MKTAILNYFKTNRSYRGGVKLIMEYSPKLGLKKQLNIHPESEYLKGCIFEELREIAGLSCSEMNTMIAMPLPKSQSFKLPVVLQETEPAAQVSGEKNTVPGPKTKKTAIPVKKTSRKK